MMKQKPFPDVLKEFIDQTAYLQIMGSFAPQANYGQIKDIVNSVYDFLSNTGEDELKRKLPEASDALTKMSSLFITKYPLKRDMKDVIFDFNGFLESGNDVYKYGIEFGWLDAQMDLTELKFYEDAPYHYRIGIGQHKDNGSIEEDFLLKDAFNVLVKAEYYQHLLNEYAKKLTELESNGKEKLTQELYQNISVIKFEIAAQSRLAIVSFYAFVESFVNSVGYSYLRKNTSTLEENEKETLNGFKKGSYLSLKSKIEKFQLLINPEKKVKVIVSDPKQIPENFKIFFNYYEQLRNSAMHYSPIKENIWMMPQEWIDRAREFSSLSMDVALEFWKACYPTSVGPEYLGKLDVDLHLQKANKRLEKIREIEIQITI
ncbi:MAG: hypothetical protein QM710_14235 [Flavobacterium sp.]